MGKIIVDKKHENIDVSKISDKRFLWWDRKKIEG